MSRRRRRSRNPITGLWQFAHEHPWLFTLFVVPAAAGVVVAAIHVLDPHPDPVPQPLMP